MSSYLTRGMVEHKPKTIYDLFRHLVNTTTYTSESDKQEFLDLIDKCEQVNMFGTTAQIIKSERGENVER